MRKVKGTRDIFKNEADKMETIRSVFLSISSKFNCNLIETPILESEELFKRSVGDSSDIVQKEMFKITADNETIVLRPEGTASVVRAISENLSEFSMPTKVSYFGPMFRKERPQKGRYRQFYQCGIEIIGESSFGPEIESLLMIQEFLTKLNITKYEIKINYLGNSQERAVYKEELVKYFTKKSDQLSSDSKERLKLNPLRILDSKNEDDIQICAEAPIIDNYLSQDTKVALENFYETLKDLNISVTQNNKLVRGLDYYTGIVFEIIDTSDTLGSQSALGGGGRYDDLIKDNKISSDGAFGFAFGVDRLLLLITDEVKPKSIDLGLITTSGRGLLILNSLRSFLVDNRVSVDLNYNTKSSFKKMFKRANNLKTKLVLVLGEDELSNSYFKIKNMETSEETKFENIDFSKLNEQVLSLLKK